MDIRINQFVAIIITALTLIPGGAHVLELPNKMALGREQYFVVQSIYQGWAWLGVILILGIAANAVLAIRMRRQTGPMLCAAASTALIFMTLAIFFTWTFPANQATANWMAVPEDWQSLRVQWEYSHAVNAALTFVALCSTTATVLIRPRYDRTNL
nr:hypothetical protein [uncultured Rhodopila sp.]